jgi:hypothetical protein
MVAVFPVTVSDPSVFLAALVRCRNLCAAANAVHALVADGLAEGLPDGLAAGLAVAVPAAVAVTEVGAADSVIVRAVDAALTGLTLGVAGDTVALTRKLADGAVTGVLADEAAHPAPATPSTPASTPAQPALATP